MHDESAPSEETGGPVVSLIEWQAPTMSRSDAARLAAESLEAFRHLPGLLEIRFFGDFESGTHCYFQVWESRAALDAFMAGEAMLQVRDAAAPYVSGRPTRRLFDDYTQPSWGP